MRWALCWCAAPATGQGVPSGRPDPSLTQWANLARLSHHALPASAQCECLLLTLLTVTQGSAGLYRAGMCLPRQVAQGGCSPLARRLIRCNALQPRQPQAGSHRVNLEQPCRWPYCAWFPGVCLTLACFSYSLAKHTASLVMVPPALPVCDCKGDRAACTRRQALSTEGRLLRARLCHVP